MTQNDPTNVFAGFEMLLKEIEIEIDDIYQVVSSAAERRDNVSASEALEKARKATILRDKLMDWRSEWKALIASHQAKTEKQSLQSERRNLGRLPHGEGTPQDAYRQSILQTLVEIGGSGDVNDVLTRVEQIMRSRLKQVDYQPLPADGMPRWSKSAQWERFAMVKEGLLQSNSPHGIWEITEAGRQALDKHL